MSYCLRDTQEHNAEGGHLQRIISGTYQESPKVMVLSSLHHSSIDVYIEVILQL